LETIQLKNIPDSIKNIIPFTYYIRSKIARALRNAWLVHALNIYNKVMRMLKVLR
jgi:hypothetical protein